MVRFLLALCLLSLGFCRVASAEYPEKTITVVCPWSAGGGTDRLSRYMADQLQSRLDTPAIVVNKTGGSGAIGHTAIAQAPPNGYTIGMITAELSTMHHMGLCNLTYRDYNCLMQLNADAAALIVRQNVPWKNLGELLEEIRRRPGELKMSGTATGGLWDLARAGMLHAADLDVSSVIWVPTKGSAPSLVDLLGGHVDAVCCSVPEAATQLEAGELRVLAVFSEERLPEFPEMPTAKEQGLDWVGMGWRGLALPKDTPPEIARRLEKELSAIVRSEDYRDFMKKNGFGIAIKGPEEFESFLEKQEDQWKEVLEAAGYTEMENHDPGPFALPIALGAVLFIGVLSQLFVFSRKPRDAETQDEENPNQEEAEKPRNASAAIVIAAMVAYLSLMNLLGFSLATVLLAGGLIWHFGSRWWTAILSAVILTVVVNALFTLIFKVPLPEGNFELPFGGTAKEPGLGQENSDEG